MNAIDAVHAAEAVQEAAWEALKAAAPVEHAAHCAAVGRIDGSPESIDAAKAALDAFHVAAPVEAAAYFAAVNVAMQLVDDLDDETFDSLMDEGES